MSTTSTPDESSPHIQPLHPSQAAIPLGNNNSQLGLGARALLSKRMAKEKNPKFVSPTDKILTPVSQKLSSVKKKHFDKGTPMSGLFSPKESSSQEDEKVNDDSETTPSQDTHETDVTTPDRGVVLDDDENPF